MFKKYFFIINPAAGRGKKLSFLSELESFCHQHQWNFEVVLSKKPREATELARKAANMFEVVVAVGGDGTVNEVANGLIGTSAVLGILPIGSGNDFAKQVGYARNLKKDLNILLKNQIKEIDVGRVNNQQYFINGMSVGFDGEVAKRARKYFTISSGFFAYLLAALRTLVTYRFPKVKITLDNNMIEQEILLTAVCNGTTYGGGFQVAPSAKMDDGLFSVCLADKMGRLYAWRNIPKMVKGTHLSLPEVRMFTSRRVIIESKDDLTAQIDGEILPLSDKYETWILEKKLKVIVK